MSMSDWNDKQNGAYMTLSTTQKYEGAKSLRIQPISGDELIKILDASESANPASANFNFWVYLVPVASQNAMLDLFFRYQDTENFYAVTFKQTYAGSNYLNLEFMKRVASTYTYGGSVNVTGVRNTWTQFKVLFCEISNSVYCLVYQNVNDVWTLKLEDTHTKHWNNGALGVGSLSGNAGSNYTYLDVLKIYYT